MSLTLRATVYHEIGYSAAQDDSIVTPTESKNTKQDTKTEFSPGTGDSQINQYYRIRDTLTSASGTHDIDLTLLESRLSDVIGFTSIKHIGVFNRSTIGSGASLDVGAAASDAWSAPFNGSTTAKTPVPTGGKWSLTAPDGMVVTSNSKVLRLTHDGTSSGDIEYDLVILGNS